MQFLILCPNVFVRSPKTFRSNSERIYKIIYFFRKLFVPKCCSHFIFELFPTHRRRKKPQLSCASRSSFAWKRHYTINGVRTSKYKISDFKVVENHWRKRNGSANETFFLIIRTLKWKCRLWRDINKFSSIFTQRTRPSYLPIENWRT